MKQTILTIKENVALTSSVYKMLLEGDVSGVTNCGQFVNIKLDGLFLRRPISVCDCENGILTFEIGDELNPACYYLIVKE